MLLTAYELIKKLQSEIGDNAEVRLSVFNNNIEIRVDWWDYNFHARRQFTEIELENVIDETIPLDFFVAWCKNEYAQKAKTDTKQPS